MTSKSAKETIVAKLGFKSSSCASKAEAELEKIRKENIHLRKKIDELAKQHTKPPDSDKNKLIHHLLLLLLLIHFLFILYCAFQVVTSLQAQLEQRRKEAEQRDMLFQNLSQETENLKNKLVTVSARCQALEAQVVPSADLALVQDQLRDALEKNQQWLVYDQQREAYVQSTVARAQELELQLAQAKLQETKQETLNAQAELQSQKEQVTRLQEEISVLQRKYEEKCSELSSFLRRYEKKSKEVEEAKMQLQRVLFVSPFSKIQLSAKDFENEKIDRQNLQHQLHKVLKELRKARDQIANLESAKQPNTHFSEPSCYNKLEFDRLTIGDHPAPASPSKVTNLLDESFLECPKCHAPYPTSRHRELLAHIDYCFA
uniref:TSG101 and ALIX binding domain-containing protein n=1 Tax=Monopterus albus TaxID=43700 RepID=A0A3Q3KP86_MONAL